MSWTKASGDFGSDVTSAEGKFTFSDFLNLFLFNQKYDIGAMVKALSDQGPVPEPRRTQPGRGERQGSQLPRRRRSAHPDRAGLGRQRRHQRPVQEFGVRLSFTPTVIGNRVHLKVKPEVSTLDYANGVVLQGFRIPGLSTRRTETELELLDGQTFAIAGLMNNTMNSTLSEDSGHRRHSDPRPPVQEQGGAEEPDRARRHDHAAHPPEELPGVTPNLPRMVEPYLVPLPTEEVDSTRRRRPSAPAAVRRGRATPMLRRWRSRRPTTNAAAAAATLRGLTPSRPDDLRPRGERAAGDADGRRGHRDLGHADVAPAREHGDDRRQGARSRAARTS